MEINFVTSNKGKVEALKNFLEGYGLSKVELKTYDLNIIESQFDDVVEISRYKALKAYEILQKPVLVEDSGFGIDALKGFPGPYSRYVVDALGVKGIIKLLEGEKNRKCYFRGCATFIDANGKIHQFFHKSKGEIIADYICDVNSPYAWSELWKIIYIKDYEKMFCELDGDEVVKYIREQHCDSAISRFVRWLKLKII